MSSVEETFYATLTDAGDPNNEGHLIVASELDLIDCQLPDWTCQSKIPPAGSKTSGS